MNILDAVGNTSMVRLRRVVPPRCTQILVKLEWENPTGSVKDRMAALIHNIEPVRTDEAKSMTRRLANEEALFAGTSSGANVVAASRVAEQLGPAATVVTLMADSGLKYRSTDVYRGA